MTKKTAAASEVDAYCTRCKLDLAHRVIAMVGDTIKKVECLTCGGHHVFRAPKSTSGGAGPRGTGRKRATRSAAGPAAVAARAADERRQQWEQAIMGRSTGDFTPYRMTEVLAEGQLVRHKKFGDGVVTDVRHDGKVRILFQAGERTLVHGMS